MIRPSGPEDFSPEYVTAKIAEADTAFEDLSPGEKAFETAIAVNAVMALAASRQYTFGETGYMKALRLLNPYTVEAIGRMIESDSRQLMFHGTLTQAYDVYNTIKRNESEDTRLLDDTGEF